MAKVKNKWLWGIGVFAMMTLSGCSLNVYPKHPGDWPPGVWGEVLQWVSSVIDFFARLLGHQYWLALLIVTVLVRLLVLPLMIKQIRLSKTMQSMQPEMQKIRTKHKGDNKKIQEETMKLYQQAGVNPAAGCFPMVVQLPVLYALYGAIEGNKLLNQSTFLWFNMGKSDPYYILPILAAITTYLSSRVMMTGSDPQQKMMLFIMPVFIFLIGMHFPAGLALYWVYTNIFTAVQSYFIKVRPMRAEQAAAKK